LLDVVTLHADEIASETLDEYRSACTRAPYHRRRRPFGGLRRADRVSELMSELETAD
jgi:hypothetical protein